MNKEQRQIAIRESQFTCAVTLLRYGKNYFDIEETLPPLLRLTADHLDGRETVKGVKVDENSDNIWVISGSTHWQKDNASRDSQIKWLKREIAEVVKTFPLHVPSPVGQRFRANHMRSVLRFLENGHTLQDYGAKVTAERGPFSAAYDRAMEQERDVDAPARAVKKKAGRHRLYQSQKAKAGGTPLSKNKRKKPPKKEKPAPNGKKWASSKWSWAADLPVLNGVTPHEE